MAKRKMDAIKVARMIQQDDLSSLHRKSFVMEDNRDNIKNKPGQKMKKKYTLNQLGKTVDSLSATVDSLSATVNNLGTTVNKLAIKVDQIADALFLLIKRFDYVVKANNLKDLPEDKKK